MRWLLDQGGVAIPNLAAPERTVGHDTAIVGWPWVADTHSWLEPTAVAILALRREGKVDHPRVREGLRLIRDRAIPTGGWNYGNNIAFGRDLRPQPAPTGIALLALAGIEGRSDGRGAGDRLPPGVVAIDRGSSVSLLGCIGPARLGLLPRRLPTAGWPELSSSCSGGTTRARGRLICCWPQGNVRWEYSDWRRRGRTRMRDERSPSSPGGQEGVSHASPLGNPGPRFGRRDLLRLAGARHGGRGRAEAPARLQRGLPPRRCSHHQGVHV